MGLGKSSSLVMSLALLLVFMAYPAERAGHAVNQPSSPQAAPASMAADSPSAERENSKILAAQYPNWARHAGTAAGMIRYELLTHIIYSYFVADADGFIHNSDPGDEANFKTLAAKAKANGVQVLLNFDGHPGAGGFSAMLARRGARAAFIRNAFAVADRHGIDGICFSFSPAKPIEMDSRLRLFREIRLALNKRSRKLLLASEVYASERWAGGFANEFFTLPDYLFVLPWEDAGEREGLAMPVMGTEYCRYALHYFERRGVVSDHLIMASPFYGRSYDGAAGLGSRFQGPGSGMDGRWAWRELLPRFQAVPYTITWDTLSKSEVASGNGETIAFNGLATQRTFGGFIRESEFGGVAAWDLSGDVEEKDKSLLTALYLGLRGTGFGRGTNFALPPPGRPWTYPEPP